MDTMDTANGFEAAGNSAEVSRCPQEQEGIRTMSRVDFVLTYDDGSKDSEEKERRSVFQKHLEEEGLQLEKEEGVECTFLKIHVPFKVMCEYADTMEFRKPMMGQFLVEKVAEADADRQKDDSEAEILGDDKIKPKKRKIFENLKWKKPEERTGSIKTNMTEFRVDLKHIFLIPKDEESFFTSSERAQVVWYILRRAKYAENKVGIISLLSDGTYKHAYPLHDGGYENENFDGVDGTQGMRAKLKASWANRSVWRKAQPLDDIREYFGDEVALYFAWLGLYTKALIPAAVVGAICFLYGLIQLDTNDREPLEDVCYGEIGQEFICKRCGSDWCQDEKLRSSCGTRWLLLMFDHPFTIAYCIFMSIWATLFLEFWKRCQSRLCLKWGGESLLSTGGSDRDTWEPRPEYKPFSSSQNDDETGKSCLKSSVWKKIFRIAATTSVVLFMVFIVISAVVGVIVYTLSVSAAFFLMDDDYMKVNSKNFASLTAAIINLIIIVLLKMVYAKIAFRLTNIENPKTQSDFDTSYTFKVFVFEFFNCYSSLFYIAFFKGVWFRWLIYLSNPSSVASNADRVVKPLGKPLPLKEVGRFYTYPSDPRMMNTLTSDSCDSGGCLAELFIQLVVIMVGKQIFNSFMELAVPRIQNWWNKKPLSTSDTPNGSDNTVIQMQDGVGDTEKKHSPWEDDYKLQGASTNPLFQDIMEIVIQYGFVTLFVVAFPLAPLCAFLNNVAEVRIDADKFVTQYRRPLPRRANSIGPWFAIQQIITYIAVAVNGFIIAFTSEFIPRLVYMYEVSPNHNLVGYVNFTLSVFTDGNHTCRYKGFREAPDGENPYDLAPIYWHILTAQLVFVVVFEHFVLISSGILAYCIADVPRSVREQAHNDREETKDILRQQRKTN